MDANSTPKKQAGIPALKGCLIRFLKLRSENLSLRISSGK
jgi:hypothetical protein